MVMIYSQSNTIYLVVQYPRLKTHDFSLILAVKIQDIESGKQTSETLTWLAEDADATG